MRYVREVACPICQAMNYVPENIETLTKTEVVRSENSQETSTIATIINRLELVSVSVREAVVKLLQDRKSEDRNDWIDIECVNTDKPYGKHSFRFHIGTGEITE